MIPYDRVCSLPTNEASESICSEVGSNTVFADEGFDGLVIHIASRGTGFSADGGHTVATVAAGEPWDAFVNDAVARGLGGVECLAGIPGTVGATPIQNVGAYGQDVGEVILDVTAIDRTTGSVKQFTGADCEFSYRQSRFKLRDADRYIITQVRFRLITDGTPALRYPDLQRFLESAGNQEWRTRGVAGLSAVRDAVIAIRKRKSMVIDPADPNSKSVGSFFTNPVLSPAEFQRLQIRYREAGGTSQVPSFDVGGAIKVPAAWLVEQAGFRRGYRLGQAGISQNHALALINCGGTTADLALPGPVDSGKGLYGLRSISGSGAYRCFTYLIDNSRYDSCAYL